MKSFLAAVALTAAFAAPALADKAAADKCAASLGADAKAIYAAAAPGFAGATDPRGLVADKTKALVQAGTVPMANARSAAESAGSCLTQLR
ncbi:hypothetical protein ABLE93_11630 [Xanthobacter sp. KR7-65]|uniref:hypothetical protein n=1 Tax=Xanthobacter sp. KR7-65 TaxID=3156612 RepID=UPI0032B36755